MLHGLILILLIKSVTGNTFSQPDPRLLQHIQTRKNGDTNKIVHGLRRSSPMFDKYPETRRKANENCTPGKECCWCHKDDLDCLRKCGFIIPDVNSPQKPCCRPNCTPQQSHCVPPACEPQPCKTPHCRPPCLFPFWPIHLLFMGCNWGCCNQKCCPNRCPSTSTPNQETTTEASSVEARRKESGNEIIISFETPINKKKHKVLAKSDSNSESMEDENEPKVSRRRTEVKSSDQIEGIPVKYKKKRKIIKNDSNSESIENEKKMKVSRHRTKVQSSDHSDQIQDIPVKYKKRRKGTKHVIIYV